MIPKKSNKLYKEVAEDLEVSETLVGELVEFYYNEIRQLLSNLVCPRINVEGLGQLCPSCYTHGTNRNNILVPEAVIINTPNNDELGSKVRQLYYETKE